MKTPTKVSERQLSGITYRQREQGFRLWVPYSMLQRAYSDRNSSCAITIGSVALTLHHRSKEITGRVPESWLIDLNAGPVECETVDEEETA